MAVAGGVWLDGFWTRLLPDSLLIAWRSEGIGGASREEFERRYFDAHRDAVRRKEPASADERDRYTALLPLATETLTRHAATAVDRRELIEALLVIEICGRSDPAVTAAVKGVLLTSLDDPVLAVRAALAMCAEPPGSSSVPGGEVTWLLTRPGVQQAVQLVLLRRRADLGPLSEMEQNVLVGLVRERSGQRDNDPLAMMIARLLQSPAAPSSDRPAAR